MDETAIRTVTIRRLWIDVEPIDDGLDRAFPVAAPDAPEGDGAPAAWLRRRELAEHVHGRRCRESGAYLIEERCQFGWRVDDEQVIHARARVFAYSQVPALRASSTDEDRRDGEQGPDSRRPRNSTHSVAPGGPRRTRRDAHSPTSAQCAYRTDHTRCR